RKCGRSSSLFVIQAEDGIRAFHVTGVQTCALPIFIRCSHIGNKGQDNDALGGLQVRGGPTGQSGGRGEGRTTSHSQCEQERYPRSEERRVGRAGMSRGPTGRVRSTE